MLHDRLGAPDEPGGIPEGESLEEASSLRALLKYARLFEEKQLPYFIVGAHAVMAHGVPRATSDLDFVVHLALEHQERVRTLLEGLGCRDFETRRDEFGHRLVCSAPEGPMLEVFFTPPHPFYDREYARRVPVDVGETRVFFLSPEDLILRKLVNTKLRRGMDYDDAVSVVATQGDRLDVEYLRNNCAPHRICALLEEALAAGRQMQGSD